MKHYIKIIERVIHTFRPLPLWEGVGGWVFLLCLASCESLDDSIGSDPYGGGKEPLGIRLLATPSTPSAGVPGDTVVFAARGLTTWCDPQSGRYDFRMYIGDEEAPIVTATDTTLTVRVPQEVSSGTTYLVLSNQVFYGPTFTVVGNVSIDREWGLFKTRGQLTGAIYDAVESPQKGQGGTFYLVGDFVHKVDGGQCRGIALIDRNGNDVVKRNAQWQCYNALGFTERETDMPYLRSIAALSDGRMIVGGQFSSYYHPLSSEQKALKKNSQLLDANNIIMLRTNALPDTICKAFDETQKTNGQYFLPFPRLNGGFKQEVLRTFVTPPMADGEQRVIAVGNFRQYASTVFAASYSRIDEQLQSVSGVCRLRLDGSRDSTYTPPATNGDIADACMDEEGGIIIVGSFTTIGAVAAPGIARITPGGDIDREFLAHIGTGFDGVPETIRYNRQERKAVVAGAFTHVGTHATEYVALICHDGTPDTAFSARGFGGGRPSFATLVAQRTPKVVVAGNFTTFGGVHRRGFLILNPDGRADQKFNVPGEFQGDLCQVIETETTLGDYGLMLLGDFQKFNGESVSGAVMLKADF